MHHQSPLMNALANGSEQTNLVVEREVSVEPHLVLIAPEESNLNAQDSIWLMFLAVKVKAAGARNLEDLHLIILKEAKEVMKPAESLLFQNQYLLMIQPYQKPNASVTGLKQITLPRASKALVQPPPMQIALTK
jgi:hypothetical protein